MALPSYHSESERESLVENVETAAEETFWGSGKGGKIAAGVAAVVGAVVLTVFAVTVQQKPATTTTTTTGGAYGDLQIASRSAPLFLDPDLSSKGGLLGALMAKYAPGAKAAPEVAVSSLNLNVKDGAKGDPAYWVMYTASTGSTCSSDSIISISGLAGMQCTPYKTSAVAAACVYGQVYLATFPEGDTTCSNEAGATVVALGSYDACTATSWGSVYTSCDMPATSMLSKYDVMSVYTASTADSASAWCKGDSSLTYAGTLFEGFPIDKCVLGTTDIDTPNSFVDTSSMKFGYQDTIFKPTYTTYPSDQVCGVSNPKQVTSTLNVECTSMVGDAPTYYKWYYRV
jgi:hypothetical protein